MFHFNALQAESPDNEGWIMKRRKNERKPSNTNTKQSRVGEKKGAVIVDLTEKSKNKNNTNKSHESDTSEKEEKLKFTKILQDRIEGKFSDEDLRLLLLRVLSKPGQTYYHISNEEINTPLPENNAIAPQPEVGDSKDEKHIVHTPEESSSSSDDGYSSDHSNNGDFGLLDSSPFALTQSFFQDTQQSTRDQIINLQVKQEPIPHETKPLPKIDIQLSLGEDLIEVHSCDDDENMQIDSAVRDQSSVAYSSKRTNNSIHNGISEDWVARKKPKTLTDYFSLSRSGSGSSLHSLDASVELKKINQESSEAVLASTTSSLKSSSSFSGRDNLPIQIEDDDFKSPSSRSIPPLRTQSPGEHEKNKLTPSKAKKNNKATSNENKFKKQEKSSTRLVRHLDPDDNGNDLEDFK